MPRPTAAVTVPATGRGRLELYFNSPLSAGVVEVEIDGDALARKPFDFYRRGFLGIRRKGAGVLQDDFTIPSGRHTVTARVRGEDGQLLGEENLTAEVLPGGRYVLKIEMESEQSPPRFALTERRER